MLNANLLYLKLVRHEMLNCKLAIVKPPTICEYSLDDFAKHHPTTSIQAARAIPLIADKMRQVQLARETTEAPAIGYLMRMANSLCSYMATRQKSNVKNISIS